MSLQVWLPLISDLHNQGLSNTTFSYINNNGKLAINNAGKIGKCYERTASGYADLYRSSTTFNLSGDLSMCCWAYVSATIGDTANGLITNHNHDNNTGVGITVKQISTSDYRISCSTGTGSSRTFCTYYGTTNIKDAWHHLALTYSKSTQVLQLWVDGVVEYTLNSYANASGNNTFDLFNWSTGYGGNSQYRPVCKLNDVRLYDHCLSNKEVKLLSQGLVAHYTLGDSYLEGTTNLVTSLTKGGQTTVSGNSVTTSGENKDTYFTMNLSESIVSGTQYTVSCYAEGIPNGSYWTFPLGSQNNTSLSWLIYNGYNSYTFTANSIDWGTNRLFMDDLNRNYYGVTRFYDFQLEKKDHATGYAGLGGTRNDTIVYDSSGYNYHGTSSGVSVSSDTPRYSVSTVFDANTDTITPTACFSVGQTMTELSVSCWFRTNTLNSTAPNMWSFGENSFARIRLANSTSIWYYVRVGSTQVSSTYSAGKTLTDNTWHHVVYVFKNGVVRVYLDNVQIGTTDHSSTATYMTCSSTAWHLAGYGANSENFIGSLSDVRIYATALSADDIKDLYQVGATVDRSGNMYAYELREV